MSLFIAQCVPGLTKRQLIARTTKLGWKPVWEPIPTLKRDGLEAFDFALTVKDVEVPVIARIRRAATEVMPARAPQRDPRQISLF